MASVKAAVVYMAGAWLGVTSAQAAHQERLHIRSGGESREYILVTPDTAAFPGQRPLVLVLHGHLGTAANALGAGIVPSPLSAWLEIADREGLLVAGLQGLRGSDHRTGWRDCRSDDTRNPTADDVGFAAAVVRELVAAGRVDAHRIYVMGMSNGAMMSYRLALEMQPAPAAIAAVSGTMAAHSDCREARALVSVLVIHGTDDPLVPYGGGDVGLGSTKTSTVIGVLATRDYWLKTDGLSNTPTASSVFPHTGADATRAGKVIYGRAEGPQVEVLTIEGGGHVEPSLRYHYGRLYAHIVGEQNRDLESAEEAWSFFRDKTSR
jgi:polyhydroxybutyrate depolymerase